MILLIIFLNYLLFYFSYWVLASWILFFILFYWIIYLIVRSWDKIIPTQSQNFQREFLYTTLNFIMYFLIVFLLFLAFQYGWIKLWFWSGVYILPLIFLYIIFHDLYFYILHRFLHLKWCLRHIHYIHHQSHISSVWTSYSFHPLEWFMYTWVVVIFFFFPLNIFALLASVLYNDFLTILWHSWKENFSPKVLKRNKVFQYIATPTYHDLHHSHSKWNYWLYFLYLDKYFDTYDKKHKDIIS